MKAYQIKAYDCDTDITLETYLNKEKAEEKLNKILQEEKEINDQFNKCCDCPIHTSLTKRKFDKSNDLLFNYCNDVKLEDLEFEGNDIWCYSPNAVNSENSYIYKLKEIDIIE